MAYITTMVVPSGPCPAKIMIVGEAPGEQEVLHNTPFVGSSGIELNKMLAEAGISRNLCFVTNVARQRPPHNDISLFLAMRKKDITPAHVAIRDKLVLSPIVEGIEMLKCEIELCRPNVIIALGNVALWALTGKWGVTKWRGSLLQCNLPLVSNLTPKVIPTIHPAMVLRQWNLRQIVVHDLRRVAKEAQSAEVSPEGYSFVTSGGFAQTCTILSELQEAVSAKPTALAVDIETRAGHIACLGIAWSAQEAICIPFMTASGEKTDHYWSEDEELDIICRLRRLLTHQNCLVLGQNFTYDAQYIYRHWFFIPNLFQDTMLSQHTCFPNMPKSLDFLSSMYAKRHVYWKDEGKEWEKGLGETQLWLYNCKDCVVTYEVAEVLQNLVDQLGLRKVHDFQQSLFAPVLDSMNTGLRIDSQRRAAFAMTLFDEIAKREQFYIDVLGHPLNPKSSPQMQQLFYGDLKQKPVFNRKTGSISCDDESLGKIAAREPLLKPFIRRITEHRSLGVFLSTFIKAPPDIDGRMRCSFNIGGTETFRFSSSKNAFGSGLNLQNIPKGGEEADGLELPNVRTLFVPDPGKTFFDIDLSAADLRIVVWESNCKEMKAMLRDGLDPYTEIAKEFYHDASINKKDPRRQKFKSFCHGTNYMGTAKGLAQRLNLSIQESEKTQKWYFNRFPEIKAWQNRLKDQIIKRRMVENVFGYRCYFFDRIQGTIFNQAAAWIPQSTVACLINRGYRNIYDNLKEVQVLLQVHDSLAGQFPTYLGEWATKRIVEECLIELPYPDDPLIIPVGIKTSTKSWGDC